MKQRHEREIQEINSKQNTSLSFTWSPD
jgi:hypothetical protein